MVEAWSDELPLHLSCHPHESKAAELAKLNRDIAELRGKLPAPAATEGKK